MVTQIRPEAGRYLAVHAMVSERCCAIARVMQSVNTT